MILGWIKPVHSHDEIINIFPNIILENMVYLVSKIYPSNLKMINLLVILETLI